MVGETAAHPHICRTRGNKLLSREQERGYLIVCFFLCPLHRWREVRCQVGHTGDDPVRLTVVMQQFFDKVDVGEDHSSTAVPLELELVEGLAEVRSATDESIMHNAHPSVISLASNSRYAFHLSPMTFPHEKQRTGMIYQSVNGCRTSRG